MYVSRFPIGGVFNENIYSQKGTKSNQRNLNEKYSFSHLMRMNYPLFSVRDFLNRTRIFGVPSKHEY